MHAAARFLAREMGLGAVEEAVPIELLVETEGDLTRFRLTGDLDLTAAAGRLPQLVREVPDGCRTVELDLANVGFLDSSGIAFLVRTRRYHQDAGRDCLATNLQGQPARVLELAGLDELSRLVDRFGG
jgi:anti-anti-sigma factor